MKMAKKTYSEIISDLEKAIESKRAENLTVLHIHKRGIQYLRHQSEFKETIWDWLHETYPEFKFVIVDTRNALWAFDGLDNIVT